MISFDLLEYLESHPIDPSNLLMGTNPSDINMRFLVPIVPSGPPIEEVIARNRGLWMSGVGLGSGLQRVESQREREPEKEKESEKERESEKEKESEKERESGREEKTSTYGDLFVLSDSKESGDLLSGAEIPFQFTASKVPDLSRYLMRWKALKGHPQRIEVFFFFFFFLIMFFDYVFFWVMFFFFVVVGFVVVGFVVVGLLLLVCCFYV